MCIDTCGVYSYLCNRQLGLGGAILLRRPEARPEPARHRLRGSLAYSPGSERNNFLHNSCPTGRVARALFLLIGNAVRCSKGWARWDANLVMQTGSGLMGT